MINKIREHLAAVSYNKVRWGLRALMTVVAMLAILLSTSGVFAIPTPGGSHPVAVGPISSDTGFPTWYKDSNGTRLELCLDAGDNPLCGFLPGDIPDPYGTLQVPNNFPEEAFWTLGSSIMTTDATGGNALLVLALEAAFSVGPVAAGDQVSFGRVRIWIDNLISGGQYKVTHPYGVDMFTAELGGGRRAIRSTEDIGIGAPGDFTGALNSRIGPFLVWDPAVLPAAPAGYIGDPNVLHPVVGSPFNTNFFRVEGPAGSFPGSPNQCADPALGDDPVATDDCIQTNEFSMVGKYATNAGVDAIRATYSRSTDLNGSLDVFASSEGGQSLEVVKSASSATTLMTGDGNGNYYARVGYDGALPPASLTIRNSSDVPVATKNISVADLVTVTRAEYNTDTDTLIIEANSSDAFLNPMLTAGGYGVLAVGSLTVNTGIAPSVITVTSAQGGSDSAQVNILGGNDASAPVVAGIAVPSGQAVPPIPPDTTLAFNVQQGQLITLDGSSSSGDIDAYSWTQVSGPVVALSGADTAAASFTSPFSVETLEFQLIVTRNSPSASDAKNVIINVQELQSPVANAGPDQQNIIVGSVVTLDGTGSQNAGSYSWAQVVNVGDPAVVLNGANTARPTFTLPNYANPLTFELTVSNAAGSATDTVQVQRTPDTFSNLRPQFIRSKNDWKITGNTQILGLPSGPGNAVRAYLGIYATEADAILANRYIGQSQVDGAGAWAIVARSVGLSLRAVAGDSITLFSSRGAYQVVFVQIK